MKSHLWLLGTLALGIWGVYAYDPTDSLMDAGIVFSVIETLKSKS
jgi:hypothetical protein